MRFSAITALCAAPLALAGTLQADLAARGAVGLEARVPGQETPAKRGKDSKSDNKGDSGNILIEQSTTVNEVIIIWVNNGGGAATSTVTDTVTVTSGATAATHSVRKVIQIWRRGMLTSRKVVVGGSAGLVYSPNSIEAAVGDMVIFTFMSQNHTVTQSAFTTPCEKLADGKDSGFMPNVNNTVSPAPQMAMQVTVATPICKFFYLESHDQF
jgi:plastocyanin